MLKKTVLILASLGLSLISLSSCASPTYKVYDTQSSKIYTFIDALPLLPREGFIILGETHYDLLIQNAEALLIRELTIHNNLIGDIAVSWEFLNYPSQEKLNQQMAQLSQGQLSNKEVVTNLFNGQPGKNLLYAPIFQVAADLNAPFVATNAPRSWKQKIVKGGITALSSDLVPAIYQRGSDEYYDRFIQAMGGHVPGNIENYFLAQSYTDAVMAESLSNAPDKSLNFMIVGHFHSDFGHGLQSYLLRMTNKDIVHIRILNRTLMSENEKELVLKPHPKYGHSSRFIFLID